MFKGYKNYIIDKNKLTKSNSTIMKKCVKCQKLNSIVFSPASNNIQACMYCGNPFYVIT